jgi:hypothetical protein
MSAAAAGRTVAAEVVVAGREAVAAVVADAEGKERLWVSSKWIRQFNKLTRRNCMKLVRWLAPAFLVLVGMANAQDVRFNYDKSADFTKYKTYKWVDIKTSDKDAMVDSQIKSTIDAELATKGLSKSESDAVDLFIGYQVAISTEKQVNTFSSDFGYGGGWGPYGRYGGMGGMGSSTSTSTTSTLYVGSLQLDFYDVPTKKAVFRAVGTKTLDAKAKPEKRQKNLSKAIKKMLKDYPPTPKG